MRVFIYGIDRFYIFNGDAYMPFRLLSASSANCIREM
jgi:hypothetical protein